MNRSLVPLCMILIVIVAAVWGCTPVATSVPPEPTDTTVPEVEETEAPPADEAPAGEDLADVEAGRVVFSEFVPGIPGDNNYEFVELYNAGMTPVDLQGWSVWYRFNESQEPKRIYRWLQSTDVPGYGHYLLVREETEVGAVPDGTFEVPLFERWGGLQLRDAEDGIVDTLGWGGEKAPASFIQDVPAAAPEAGASLERLPGGAEGNGQDTDDSTADFMVQMPPMPQNSGMAITPLPEKRLAISASAPDSVTPGTNFDVTVTVENLTGQEVTDLDVTVPLPDGVVLMAVDGVAVDEHDEDTSAPATWRIAALPDGGAHQTVLTLRSPWQYGMVHLTGYGVVAADWPMAGYGPLTSVEVAGGAIPIGTARGLDGQLVTVEGVATMYTGGYYAGSTGTKFYLEDETGGIQVYCPDGQGVISVQIGDRVRVTGGVEIYRDSLELVPGTYPDDVEILEEGAEALSARVVSGAEATRDETLPGSLIQVEGTIARFEEFSYSYEVDLLDAAGDQVLVYIDKETRMVPEFLEVGDSYRVAGISEVYDGQWQLKPRVLDDFIRVYPPELMLDVMARNSVEPGGVVTYTLTAHNYTAGVLTDVRITANPPANAVTVLSTTGEPVVDADGSLVWTIAELPADGGEVVVTYVVQVGSGVVVDRLEAGASVVAAEWPDPVVPQPWLTFLGSGVPIWAIQGSGARSPFALTEATTVGVVTGVFPEQEGFWIQSLAPDDDPQTSEGLFVETGALEPLPVVGDRVEVTGKVRERSGQTLLDVPTVDAIEITTGPFDLPAPVVLDPPRDEAESRAYYEALEGMLVEVGEPVVAVGPTSQYGESPLVAQTWGIDRVRKGEPKGMLIFADDGSAVTHVNRTTLPFAVKTGDLVAGLVGPLSYTYENYKIQPVVTPTVISEAVSLPALAPAGPDAFSIATFNAENLFDFVDPHPSSPERPTISAYKARITKAAATLEAMGLPAIVGLQEVENIGILEDIAEDPLVAQYGYVPVLIEGFDSRGIDVGYLVRGDMATLEGVSQHSAPEGLTSRPPLMITVTVHLAGGDQSVVVFNNHFTSMSGGELATEPRRVAQAAWNAGLVSEVLAADPDALVAVLGDLNSFYQSPPLDVLRDAGMNHVYEAVEPDIPYTYIYQGESETLDHMLVSPSLFAQVTRVEALHVNADFPLPYPEDTSPERLSDHDPLVVTFEAR